MASGIDISFDPVMTAAHFDLTIDRRKHRVLRDSSFVRWARKRFRRPTLFEYQHLEEGSTVLADWVVKGKVAQELEVYDLENGGKRPDEAYMVQRMVSAREGAKRMRKGFNDLHALRREMMIQAKDQQKDRARYLRKHGMAMEAKLLEMSGPSWCPGREGRIQQWREELLRAASERVISIA